jgi:hypothetical protein
MSQKPPPIKVSAQGIEAKPVTMNEPVPVIDVDWRKVASLPSFQMFLAEKRPCPPEADSERWAFEFISNFIREIGEEALLQRYVAWHGAKGYWPNETPLGEVMSCSL